MPPTPQELPLSGSRVSTPNGNSTNASGAPVPLVLFLALVGISFAGPLVRLSHAHPLTIAIWRLGFALVFILAALLAMLGWLVDQPWFYAGLGVPGPAPRYGVALVLFMLALSVFTFLAAPLAALYSRKHEFEADEYAARNASAPALVAALVKLYEDNANTLTPDPLHSAFYDSHPPAAARIARLEAAPR